MSANGQISEKTPLSILLFHAAMQNHQSMSDFAKSIKVGPVSLRQFLTGSTQRPRSKTVDLIGDALNMTADEVRQRMEHPLAAAPAFSDWLSAHMDGRYSRSRLAKDSKISDSALRNYLNGQTLPDADQAQKLAETLQISTMEIARVVVANQMTQDPDSTFVEASDEDAAPNAASGAEEAPSALGTRSEAFSSVSYDEERILALWRRLHPQGRRATMHYIADLLAEA